MSDIKDHLVIPMDNGYELFGKYRIFKTSNTGFLVNHYFYHIKEEFFHLKAATAWCTFDNYNKYQEARRVKYLDKRLSELDSNVKIYQKSCLAKNIDEEQKETNLTKLVEEKYKQERCIREIDRLANYSHAIQSLVLAENVNSKKQKFKS